MRGAVAGDHSAASRLPDMPDSGALLQSVPLSVRLCVSRTFFVLSGTVRLVRLISPTMRSPQNCYYFFGLEPFATPDKSFFRRVSGLSVLVSWTSVFEVAAGQSFLSGSPKAAHLGAISGYPEGSG